MIFEKTAYGTTTTDTCRREESALEDAARFSATHIENLEARLVTSTPMSGMEVRLHECYYTICATVYDDC